VKGIVSLMKLIMKRGYILPYPLTLTSPTRGEEMLDSRSRIRYGFTLNGSP
jgi:hypothetical protein